MHRCTFIGNQAIEWFVKDDSVKYFSVCFDKKTIMENEYQYKTHTRLYQNENSLSLTQYVYSSNNNIINIIHLNYSAIGHIFK